MNKDKILEKLLTFQSPLAPDRERELPWVIERLPAEVKILDAACGGGYLQKYLLEEGHKVVATDFQEDAMYYSTGGEKRPNFILHDHRTDVPVDWIDAFDCVLLISTIEHLEDGDDFLVVSQLSKCLKPNGLFFITCPCGKDEWLHIGSHIEKFYSLDDISNRLLLPNGLIVKESEVFTKEDMGWPFTGTPDEGADWKDIICTVAVKI